jgi:nitroimidazol reductase NimA-like FMN-containing flavoprotein (pyridoxamine 5'-phosphate oxidase superfamily)
VVLGTAVEITDETERLAALETISEHIIRGRWTEIRPPNPLELRAARVLPLPIEEASAKVRTGPPVDDEEDYDLRWSVDPEHGRIQGFTAGDETCRR